MTTSVLTGIETLTKSGLRDFLVSVQAKVMDDNLKHRITYALEMLKKDVRKVKKTDLLELAKEFALSNVTTKVALPIENKLKPAAKKAPVEEPEQQELLKDEEVEEEIEETDEIEEEKPVKKSPLKKGGSKKGSKEEPKKLDKNFPPFFLVEGVGKLKKVDVSYADFRKLAESEEGKELYLACLWKKSDIKKYNYAEITGVPAPVEGFHLDLDLYSPVLFNDVVPRFFASSVYTEAFICLQESNFDRDENEARSTNGMLFEVYEVVEQASNGDEE